MTVKMVENDVKVEMYIDHKDMGLTLTEIGKEYDVSRKTVRRCIDEVQDMILEIEANIAKELPYQNSEEIVKVRIESMDSPVTDDLPVYGREEDKSHCDWFYLAGFMSAKEVTLESGIQVQEEPKQAEEVSEEIVAGSRVQIREDSEYYGRNCANPDNSVKGTVVDVNQELDYCYSVDWDNGYGNVYRNGDLELAVEEVEEVQGIDNAEYMVTAPQDSITIIRIDGDTGEVTQRQTNKHRADFKALRDMLKEDLSQETLYKVYCELDTERMLEAFSVGRVKVSPEDETVVFVKADGSERKVPDDIAADIVATVRQYGRAESEKLVKFLDKLMDNSSFSAIEGLYLFMKHNCITINDDGSIEAWKGVQRNLYSKRAGNIKNSPTCPVADDGRIYNGNFGVEIRVDRSEVNDNPDETCSHGLHVGNKDYASGWAETLLKVKVEPQDVVAVPKDLDGAKMRCCAYTPLQVVDK